MVDYAVAHLDEIEELADAGCHYRPIRHHLGHAVFEIGGDRVDAPAGTLVYAPPRTRRRPSTRSATSPRSRG